MTRPSTSALPGYANVAPVTVVSRRGFWGDQTAATLDIEPAIQWTWRLTTLVIPDSLPAHEPEPMLLKRVPPCIDGFVAVVAAIESVRCIVIEEEEDDVVHLTTFASPITEEVLDAVHDAEFDTIQANPELHFDFHLRRADEVVGTPSSTASTRHYFAIWGELNAEGE